MLKVNIVFTTLFAITPIVIMASSHIVIRSEPLCEVATQKELYNGKKLDYKFFGDQRRASTCSGIGWFHDNNYLATINYDGCFIATYHFNKETNQCTLLQVINTKSTAPLRGGELLSISNDGTLLAVSLNRAHALNIYSINTQTHIIDPKPLFIIKTQEPGPHGVRFSHNKKYLGCTTIHLQGDISIYALTTTDEATTFSLAATLKNNFFPLRPKSLYFTKDDAYVVVSYTTKADAETAHQAHGILASYAFNQATGSIEPTPISVFQSDAILTGADDITFATDDAYLIVSEQATDKITFIAFDKTTGQIGKKLGSIQNPEAKLSFPHGISLSSDGKYLAVTNYGDDKFSIYDLKDCS
jgi:6-phosphogluconolactonase (cycloisomerase 2 family)